MSSLLIGLLFSLMGCGAEPVASIDEGGDEKGHQPTDRPSPVELANTLDKEATECGLFNVFGRNYIACSSNVTELNFSQSVRLNATGGEVSWAAYGWYGINPESEVPQEVIVSAGGSGKGWWVLLPDFERNCWEPAGPFHERTVYLDVLETTEHPIGPDGVFYVMVVVHDGSSYYLNSINPGLTGGDTAPLASRWLEASYDTNAQGIRLEWDQPIIGSDHVLRRWRASQSEDQAVRIVTSESGYLDTDVQPDRDYYYRVSHRASGMESEWSPVALGRRLDPEVARDGHEVSGRFMYDEHYGVPGIELHLSLVNRYASTDRNGRFVYHDLPTFAGSLQVISPGQPQDLGTFTIDCDLELPEVVVGFNGAFDPNWYWIYPPVNLNVVPTSRDSFDLSWAQAEYASSYKLYRSQNLDMSNPLYVGGIGGGETSTHIHAQPEGVCYYAVRSVEAGEDGFVRQSCMSPPVAFDSDPNGIMPDRLYLVPDKTRVNAGESVLITVYCDRTANRLSSMNSVSVTFPVGDSYKPGSFNIGAPGGGYMDADGVWSVLGPGAQFLLPQDDWMAAYSTGDGRMAIDFNITPIWHDEILLATGALFNFELVVNTDTDIKFQRINVVSRTYYSEADCSVHYWTNDGGSQPKIFIID